MENFSSDNRPSTPTTTTAQIPENNFNTVEFVSSYSLNQPIKLRIRRARSRQYRISPIHSEESDADDSDVNLNFKPDESENRDLYQREDSV